MIDEIIKGTDGYNLLIAIERGSPAFKKIGWDYQRKFKNINDIKLPSEEYSDRIVDWRRKCSHPYCSRGFQKLSLNGNEFKELINNETLIVEKVIEIASRFEEPILIEGGHFIPELSNFDFVPEQPFNALRKALGILHDLAGKYNKKVDLLLFINDLHMGKGQYLSRINRHDYFEDFVLPNPIKEIILDFQSTCKFNVFVTSEKKMALKLNREKGNFIKDNKVKRVDNKYLLTKTINNYENFEIINNSANNPLSGFIKCMEACSRVIKLASEMGYKNYIQIYPVCAFQGTELSYKIAEHLYEINLNIMNIYTTITCFSDRKEARYRPSKPLNFI